MNSQLSKSIFPILSVHKNQSISQFNLNFVPKGKTLLFSMFFRQFSTTEYRNWEQNILPPKGQLISKGHFDVVVLTKKTTFYLSIPALASEKRSDKKGTLCN